MLYDHTRFDLIAKLRRVPLILLLVMFVPSLFARLKVSPTASHCKTHHLPPSHSLLLRPPETIPYHENYHLLIIRASLPRLKTHLSRINQTVPLHPDNNDNKKNNDGLPDTSTDPQNPPSLPHLLRIHKPPSPYRQRNVTIRNARPSKTNSLSPITYLPYPTLSLAIIASRISLCIKLILHLNLITS